MSLQGIVWPLASPCAFSHVRDGATNRSLHALVAAFLPGHSPRQMGLDRPVSAPPFRRRAVLFA
jgi:hypothetical protein